MLCLLHGYLLEGSGSNIWTRSIVKSLCEIGQTVHLICQENHPERYDFISKAFKYYEDESFETILSRKVSYDGECLLHKPQLGDTLPVYVADKYEEFSNVVLMTQLSDEEIEDYLERNTRVLMRVTNDFKITAIHANHAVLMSVVAQRVSTSKSIPFVIMPHGSAIEYVVKKDQRFLKLANNALRKANKIICTGDEMQARLKTIFSSIPALENKITKINLGVDSNLFKPITKKFRKQNIENIKNYLSEKQRGKKPEHLQTMLKQLNSNIKKEEFVSLMKTSFLHNSKLADSDIETKFENVNWQDDKLILFVGHLIPIKGLQYIVTALPLILEKQPDTKLIAVGYGPLREPMEALLWALEKGENNLAKNILTWTANSAEESFSEIIDFFNELKNQKQLDAYYEKAQKYQLTNKVIFTGFLSHQELCYLYPCCDAAIFPSMVKEAGPLVFLEALASGCFPLGTYFGGMKVSIDSVAPSLPECVADLMKLSEDKNQIISDIANKTPQILKLEGKYKQTLQNIAVKNYDWQSIAKKLQFELNQLSN